MMFMLVFNTKVDLHSAFHVDLSEKNGIFVPYYLAMIWDIPDIPSYFDRSVKTRLKFPAN